MGPKGRPLAIQTINHDHTAEVHILDVEKAVERAGLWDFRFHDLRHTAARHLAVRGRPLKEIQEGEKSFSMTLRYAHLSPMHLRTAVEALDGLTSIDNVPQMDDKRAQKEHFASVDEISSAK